MKLLRGGRIWNEQADHELSEDLETDSEIETDSTDCSSEFDDVSDEASSRRSLSLSDDDSWRTGQFSSNKLTFSPTYSGCPSNIYQKMRDSAPLDFFNLFFDQNLMRMIVEQTNLYHDQTQGTVSKPSKQHPWLDVTIDEMYIFLAATMLISSTEKDKLVQYLSSGGLMKTAIFNESFSHHRYFAILRNLHFNHNDHKGQDDDDRRYKVNPVLYDLREKFSKSFYPYQNICIDESMLSPKGQLKFQHYIA